MKRINGFICPKCGQENIGEILDSRYSAYGKRRRRVCEKCGERYTTVEVYMEKPTKFCKAYARGEIDGHWKT